MSASAALADAPAHATFCRGVSAASVDAYRLARWLTGSRADAEDIVQEASLRAFRGIGRFGGANRARLGADDRAQRRL